MQRAKCGSSGSTRTNSNARSVCTGIALSAGRWHADARTQLYGRKQVTDTHGRSPTVLRMILARQLQALREKAGLSYEQAAEAIYSSEWTVRRMERAEGGLKPLTVKSLLMAYGITDPAEIDAFLTLARG